MQNTRDRIITTILLITALSTLGCGSGNGKLSEELARLNSASDTNMVFRLNGGMHTCFGGGVDIIGYDYSITPTRKTGIDIDGDAHAAFDLDSYNKNPIIHWGLGSEPLSAVFFTPLTNPSQANALIETIKSYPYGPVVNAPNDWGTVEAGQTEVLSFKAYATENGLSAECDFYLNDTLEYSGAQMDYRNGTFAVEITPNSAGVLTASCYVYNSTGDTYAAAVGTLTVTENAQSPANKGDIVDVSSQCGSCWAFDI